MAQDIPLSRRVRDLHPSPIREILAVIDRPGMISFAGGLPAPESFPDLDAGRVPRNWLQYGPTEGDPALRRRIAEELQALGLSCGAEQVLVLSGSQQGIDLVAKLFVDEGTPVAVESPTYLAALQVFRFYGARFVAFDPRQVDVWRDAGPPRLTAFASPQGGEASLGTARREAGPRPAFAYAIPTFQNPTGHCYSTAEREALARRCDEEGIVLFEDDPYRDLAYDPCDRTPVCSLVKCAPWIYQGSFSKTFAPGLRLGFLAASAELVPYLTRLKQAADLHSSRVSQWLVLQQMNDPSRAQRMTGLVDIYRRKRDAFARQLKRHLGHLATWETPRGGLFFWLALNRSIDTRALLALGIERGVAFMPGEPFFPGERGAAGALRLNFSHATEEQAERGLSILAELLAHDLASLAPKEAAAIEGCR